MTSPPPRKTDPPAEPDPPAATSPPLREIDPRAATSPPPAEADPPPVAGASAEAYVVANRDRFTLAALRRALIAAGHDPVDIAAALSRVPPPGPPASAVPAGATAARRLRGRIAVGIVALGAVALFLGVSWWYTQSMSTIGALIAGVLLAFGIGIGFLPAMTALSEKSARLWRGNIVSAIAAAVTAPLLVLLVLTGICVAVSRPIDWVTGGR